MTDETCTITSNLVARLRSIHDFEHDETEAICVEAADEIERLNKLVSEHCQAAFEMGAAWGTQSKEIARLREAVQWVVRDAAYKAPEQMGPAMAARWIGRLRSALAGSADETSEVQK